MTQMISINQVETLLDKLKTVFPPITITPKKTHDELMFDGGKQAVIQYIAGYIQECQRRSNISP